MQHSDSSTSWLGRDTPHHPRTRLFIFFLLLARQLIQPGLLLVLLVLLGILLLLLAHLSH